MATRKPAAIAAEDGKQRATEPVKFLEPSDLPATLRNSISLRNGMTREHIDKLCRELLVANPGA